MLLNYIRNSACLLAVLWLHGCLTIATQAQDYEDEPLEFLPGLVAEFRWAEQSARRLDPDILFDWSAAPPSTQMPPASLFSVTWKGQLQAKENGQFRLSLFVSGRVKVVLANEVLLDTRTEKPQWLSCPPVELRFGHHDLQVEFEKTNATPRVSLFWQGPTFALEPISPRYFFHRNEPELIASIDGRYERGRVLSRGLRCAACHEFSADTQAHSWGAETEPLAAPALTHLQDNLRPSWLIARLSHQPAAPPADNAQRVTDNAKDDVKDSSISGTPMPHFALHPNDAAAITAALFAASAPPESIEPIEPQLRSANKRRQKKDAATREAADPHQGEITFVSTGCLACHQLGQLGHSADLSQQLFGGGDLSSLAAKRTKNFVERWLENPAHVNADHRMPNFELSLLEQLDLTAYLTQLAAEASRNDTQAAGDQGRGIALIEQHRCGACHKLPASLAAQQTRSRTSKILVTAESNWDAGCLTTADATRHLPGFALGVSDRQSLRHYFTQVNPSAEGLARGAELIQENNCLACHSRDLAEGIKAQLSDIVAAVPEVAPRLAAIAPPSLTAVGDKYHDAALQTAIAQKAAPLRPWLDIRMPKFRLNEQQLAEVAQHFIAHDRIPESDDATLASKLPIDQLPSDTATRMAAGRLVTAEGFGCQSCHQIGEAEMPKVDLNARGTNLAMLGDRVRPSWFNRWVRNPARIVPRMEMPAIQTAVRGVLHDSLDMQLAALWTTLNTPDFRPPRPSPVRVVRTHNLPELSERAWLLTDVIETPHKNYLRPLVIGLPNRHNFLFDLESGTLAAWWLGDTAHQHTRGKSWYWEPGAGLLNTAGVPDDSATGKSTEHNPATSPQPLEQIRLVDRSGKRWSLAPLGQFAARFDRVEHIAGGIVWHGRLHLTETHNTAAASGDRASQAARWLTITQTLQAAGLGAQATTICETELGDLQPGDHIQLSSLARLKTAPSSAQGTWQVTLHSTTTSVTINSPSRIDRGPDGCIAWTIADDAATPRAQAGRSLRWTSTYSSPLPTDQFPQIDVPEFAAQPTAIHVVPGYDGVQLPLPVSEMPISFAWDPRGRFYAGSLKGRVLEVLDKDSDGLPDSYAVISDEFPTPFGLFADETGIDALAKFALIRLTPPDIAGRPYAAQVVADGWGYTADYHDWAIGLERDADNNYYMALPCQQDDRSQEAAYLRGQALKLIPYNSKEEPRNYRIEPLSAGLRFPMGIALNANQDLFTSDNQGNYNPFNELNHLRPGKRYGFINKLENKDGFSPAFESPAINLPHPWTRSVNGICFLQTPSGLRSTKPHFGSFEGHLIGCEMNGKSLVRMSLQKVGDTYQGAAYMFSRPAAEGEANFEGPIVCEVSPEGDLLVGSLQDSGWSGGQNTGSIVRLRPNGKLPLGIAEVRGTATGFEVDFTQPVDRQRAAQSSSYQLRSYQRISTPAYGGDDQDERNERIDSVQVSEDGRRVSLQLPELRAGFVYELNIAPLGANGEELFPSQAHYNMRTIPH